MTGETQVRCCPSIRQFFFYSSQWASNMVIAFCVGSGIIAIQVMVEAPEVKSFLTLLFAIITLLLAGCHLFFSVRIFSQVMRPIETLSSCADKWLHLTEGKVADEVSLDNIRTALQSLQQSRLMWEGRYPQEVRQLQVAFEQTLKLMESAWQQVEGNAILLGMGKICSQVAHDIRGPITSIRLLSECMRAEADDENKGRFETITSCVDRMDRMADELLEYRRASAVQMTPMDLSSAVKDILAELQVGAHKAGVTLDVALPEGLPLHGDADKLGRVVQNLIQNSIQVLSSNKVADGVVRVTAVPADDQILLSVRDNGPGIPSEYEDQVFKTSFTTKGKRGTGLGLIYCANVIKAHGGRISAHNYPEGGAEFTIQLPLQMAH